MQVGSEADEHEEPERPPACGRYVVVTTSFGFVAARCACGWLSAPVGTSGMAGTLWDAHIGRDDEPVSRPSRR
jgi:hypothetical protein